MKDVDEMLSHVRLLFSVEHPNLDDCWAYGYKAAGQSLPETDNPFKADTIEHDYWSEGWWAGFCGEPQLFEETALSAETPVKPIGHVGFLGINQPPANASVWEGDVKIWAKRVAKVAGVIAATAVVGYQIIEMVA